MNRYMEEQGKQGEDGVKQDGRLERDVIEATTAGEEEDIPFKDLPRDGHQSRDTESPARDWEYVIIVWPMTSMESKSLTSTFFRALSFRTFSAVLAVSISSMQDPTEQTTSNSWASPRPVTRADSVSIESGRWRIWILVWPS
jgi:hypothetical protein